MNYHAHVYFKNISDVDYFDRIKKGALGQGLTYHMLANRPVGPHPFPMAEFHFSKAQYEKVKIFFQEIHNQLGLTTLLHIDTGDDLFDHSEGAEWVGPMVDLDFEFFELIKRDPSKRIHK
jgi:DOPA 4,5-dioxygenase